MGSAGVADARLAAGRRRARLLRRIAMRQRMSSIACSSSGVSFVPQASRSSSSWASVVTPMMVLPRTLPAAVAPGERHAASASGRGRGPARCSGARRPAPRAGPSAACASSRTALQPAGRAPGRRVPSASYLPVSRPKASGEYASSDTPVPVQRLVEAVVDAAADQAVGVLHRRDARQAVLLGEVHELAHAVGRLVRQADRAHLARLHQPVERFELLLHAGVLVRSLAGSK